MDKIIKLNLEEIHATIANADLTDKTKMIHLAIFSLKDYPGYTSIFCMGDGMNRFNLFVSANPDIYTNVTKNQALSIAGELDTFDHCRGLDDRDEEDAMKWIDRTIRNVLEMEKAPSLLNTLGHEDPRQSKPAFRLVVAGTRTFKGPEAKKLLDAKLDMLLSKKAETHDITIISGTCSGADRLGELYAEELNYKVDCYAAEWDKYGNSAGPRRNREMAQAGDALVAFWDYESGGTKNMIDEMQKLGKPVVIVDIRAKTPAEPIVAQKPTPVAPAPKKTLFAFVDGSWTPNNPDVFGSAFVMVEKTGDVSRKMGDWARAFADKDAAASHNVAGEVYAAIAAMEWANRRGIPICIVYDYNGLEKWCTKEWKAQKPISQKLTACYDRMPKGLITFRKVAAHSGNKWNDLADELARNAIQSFLSNQETAG